MMLLMFMAEKH